MATRKTPRRLTKKAFLEQATRGALSTDRVLADLVAELHGYEQKYGMHSEIFYALIAGTPAEDHPDFLQWAMCYRTYFRAVQAKFPLKDLTSDPYKRLCDRRYYTPSCSQQCLISPPLYDQR